MLPRVLEPEAMDTPEEARDYDAMDHAAVNRAFVDDLLRVWPPQESTLRVLDVGTGTAQIPIELCRRSSRFFVQAIDLAGEMLTLAQLNVARAGLDARIDCQPADAKQLADADDSYDLVISNSIVHHIPEPRAALREAARVCRRGGGLFFRDLLRPASLAELRRLVKLYAAGANEHQRALFAASLHAALTLDEVRDLVSELGFASETVAATSDRHWTWSARRV